MMAKEAGMKGEGNGAGETPAKRARSPRRRTAVTLIGSRGTNVCVQYTDEDGFPHRVQVPHEELKDGKVFAGVLSAGLPYGEAWEDYVDEQTITSAEVAGHLRKKGIWSLEDLEANPRAARIALSLPLAVNVATLRRKVRAVRIEAEKKKQT